MDEPNAIMRSSMKCCYVFQVKEAHRAVPSEIRALVKALPMYVWLIVLPQLTSRICHPNKLTQDLTHHLLTHITAAYPQQACQIPLQQTTTLLS